jgi:glycosyltransferase involved in cell wall biosynthesis
MQKLHPLVSVIVPSYNHEKYILEALESVIQQTYGNIELIVIDDGSTDSTKNLIGQFIASNERFNITFRAKENEGVCKALNLGLDLASGDYVAFLASDDVWQLEKIEKQVDFMEKNTDLGLGFSDAFFIIERCISSQKWSDYKPQIAKYFLNGIQRKNMYESLFVDTIIPALTVILRSSAVKAVGGFDEDLIYEDDDMWLRIAQKFPIGYLDEPLAFYRRHDSNISNNTGFMLRGYLGTIRKHFSLDPLRSEPTKRIKIVLRAIFRLSQTRIARLLRARSIKKNH